MTAPLLSVRELTVEFGGRRGDPGPVAEPVVDGVSFDIRPGEVVGIVGKSGSGKTTLALSVLGLLPAAARIRSGSIRWLGENLLEAQASRWREVRGREIAMVFQDPLSALHPALPVVDQVAEALRTHRPDLGREPARHNALERLAAVGISRRNLIDDYPHHWSGGMRQRALITMALANDPRLLIADEPTTALDVTVQARVINLLRRTAPAAGEHGSGGATLLITHDFGLIAELADRVLVMSRGRIVERGSVQRIFDCPDHPQTRTLLAARHGAAVHHAVQRPGSSGRSPIDRTDVTVASTAATALEVTDLCAEYEPISKRSAPVRAVQNVSFCIRAGETFGLVGESGSGKTSIARVLAGLLPATGRIRVAGRSVAPSPRRELSARRILQVVFQDPYGSLNPRRRIGDSIAEPLRIHRLEAGRRRERVHELLELVELDPSFAERLPAELSGGECQRAAIARALACRPEVLILDEPVTSLDMVVQSHILALLDALQKELGMALLLIAHDLRMVRDVADRVAVMQAGRLVEIAPTAKLFERPGHPETRRLLAAIPADHPSRRAGSPPSPASGR